MDPANIETKKIAVTKFLEDFKNTAQGKRPKVIPREKNLQTLIDLNLTLNDQAAILLSLTTVDYVSGPDQDRDRRGQVWVFGTMVGTVELYIKLKITEYKPVDRDELVREAVCLSFHPADGPQQYPLKNP